MSRAEPALGQHACHSRAVARSHDFDGLAGVVSQRLEVERAQRRIVRATP